MTLSVLLTKPAVVGVLLVGCTLSLALFLHSFGLYPYWSTEQRADVPVVNDWSAPIANADRQRKPTSGAPKRLVISAIGVDASLEYVGITGAGAMDTPKDPADAAWFKLGPRPGETGSAVIAGHYGWKNNTPAVFDNLSDLKTGDKILVEDESGVEITFVVRELRIYGEDDTPPGVFSSYDGNAHLNLITCGGVWDATRKSYPTRVVVFADKEQ